MKILLNGYFDCNFGDDLMMRLAYNALPEHEIYVKKNKYTPDYAHEFTDTTEADVSLTVTGSGFLLYGYKSALYRINEIRKDKLQCKRVVLNANISPFPNKFAERVILKQLSRLDFITVRDKYSYNYIKKHLPNLQCEYYPDIAFSMPEDMISDVSCENALGIAAYKSDYSGLFSRLCDEYAERTGNKILIFALDTGKENDLTAAEEIKKGMKHECEIIGYDGILKNIRRCSKIITTRFHSLVISLLAGVDIIPIAYSDKICHVLSDLKFDGKVFDLKKLDYGELFEEILSDNHSFLLNKSVSEEAKNHINRFKELILK